MMQVACYIVFSSKSAFDDRSSFEDQHSFSTDFFEEKGTSELFKLLVTLPCIDTVVAMLFAGSKRTREFISIIDSFDSQTMRFVFLPRSKYRIQDDTRCPFLRIDCQRSCLDNALHS